MNLKSFLLGFIAGILLMWAFAAWAGFYAGATLKNKPVRINRLTGKTEIWNDSAWKPMK